MLLIVERFRAVSDRQARENDSEERPGSTSVPTARAFLRRLRICRDIRMVWTLSLLVNSQNRAAHAPCLEDVLADIGRMTDVDVLRKFSVHVILDLSR